MCVFVVFVCLCYVHFAHNRLLQLASVVCLVGCGLVSCDATLVTEFLDINHGHQVVGADSCILQCACRSINSLVAGVFPTMGEKMLTMEADFYAAQEVLPVAVIKCFTNFVFNWLIHAFVKPNLHLDSARLKEGVIVL